MKFFGFLLILFGFLLLASNVTVVPKGVEKYNYREAVKSLHSIDFEKKIFNAYKSKSMDVNAIQKYIYITGPILIILGAICIFWGSHMDRVEEMLGKKHIGSSD